MTDSLRSLHRLVWTALCAALIAAGAYLHLPLGPAPFTFQLLFIFLTGMALGPVHGAGAVLLYVAAGAAGLPVFAGGKAGLGVLAGPTGGYLAGYVLCAAILGLARWRGSEGSWPRCALLGLAGLVPVYGLGLLQLSLVTGMGLGKAFWVGVAPFVPFDLIKLGLAVAAFKNLARNGLLPR